MGLGASLHAATWLAGEQAMGIGILADTVEKLEDEDKGRCAVCGILSPQ